MIGGKGEGRVEETAEFDPPSDVPMSEGKRRLNTAFGLTIDIDEETKEVKPPPPNVLRVLGEIAYRRAVPAAKHGVRGQKRSVRRRRQRRRLHALRQTTMKSMAEAQAGTSSSDKWEGV